jgi:hypothetical protein
VPDHWLISGLKGLEVGYELPLPKIDFLIRNNFGEIFCGDAGIH